MLIDSHCHLDLLCRDGLKPDVALERATAVGVGGVVLLMVAHGFSVALLFLLATTVHHRTHTFTMEDMGGLALKAPVLAAFFVVVRPAKCFAPSITR